MTNQKIDEKGVLSVDLIFSFLVVLLIAMGLCGLIMERMDVVDESEKLSQMRIMAENVANNINKVYGGGYGHEIKIKLPSTLKNLDSYLVRVTNDGVYIESEGMVGKAEIYDVMIVDSEMKQNEEIKMFPGMIYVVRNEYSHGKTFILIKNAN